MTETVKAKPLEVGQRVFLEVNSYRRLSEGVLPTLHEAEVINVNTAYASLVLVEDLEKGTPDTGEWGNRVLLDDDITRKPLEHKIKLDTLKGKGVVDFYTVWFTPEEFNQHLEEKKLTHNLRRKAYEMVHHLPLKDLQDMLTRYGD